MALITRVSRLFKADIHAVIDNLEEPDIVLRQAIREMQESVSGSERAIAQMGLEKDELQQAISTKQGALKQIDEELDICFISENEPLTKTLIKKKLETERHQNQLATLLERLLRRIQETTTQHHERQSQLDSMQQKAALFVDEGQNSPYAYTSMSESSISEDDIEIAYLKELKKRNSV